MKICKVCWDRESNRYTVWSGDGEYSGCMVCGKHYTQLRKFGDIVDKYPSSHIDVADRICDVCGSNHHVIYHMGKYVCLRHYSQIKNLGGLLDITVKDRNEYDIIDGVGHIYLRNYKNERIAETIVDAEELDRLLVYKWRLGTWGYCDAVIDGRNIMMQRFILGEYDKDKIPDHINRNPLDNRRCNLRIVDKSMNAINCGVRPNNKSGVTGVSWSNAAKLWRAYINSQGKRIELGYFKNKEDAIIARLNAENKYYPSCQPQIDIFSEYGVDLIE